VGEKDVLKGGIRREGEREQMGLEKGILWGRRKPVMIIIIIRVNVIYI